MDTKNNNLDSVIVYLKTKKNPAAITDKKLGLIWSSDDVLWQSAAKRISIPVDTERVFTVVYNSERCPAIATEYICTDKQVYYIFELYDSNTLSILMKKSLFIEKLKNAVDLSAIEIRKIIGLGIGLSNSLTNRKRKEQRKTIEAQFLCASDLLAQSMNISCFMDDELSYGSTASANIKPIFDAVYEVFNEQLSRFGREISFISDTSTGQVALSERKLTIMLLNLVQNAFLYSPKNSQITMHLNYTKNKARIKISNYKRKDIEEGISNCAGAGVGMELAETIAESGGGALTYSETAKKAQVVVELPIVNSVSEIELKSGFLATPNDRFSPIGLFLNRVLKYEMDLDD